MTGNVVTLASAVLGAVAGYFLFRWLLSEGFYALVLPGAIAGIAAGFAHCRARWVPVACAAIAIAAGLTAEFLTAPFQVDPSVNYFLAHVFDLRPLTLVLIALGGVIGFYGPYRARVITLRKP